MERWVAGRGNCPRVLDKFELPTQTLHIDVNMIYLGNTLMTLSAELVPSLSKSIKSLLDRNWHFKTYYHRQKKRPPPLQRTDVQVVAGGRTYFYMLFLRLTGGVCMYVYIYVIVYGVPRFFLLILTYFPLSYRDKFGISGKVLMRPLYFKDRNSTFQR